MGKLLVGIAALCILMGVGIGAYFLLPNIGGKIPEGVRAAGISIGGLTPRQASQKLSAIVSDVFREEDMVIRFAGEELRLSPEESGVGLDMDALLADAKEGQPQELGLGDYLKVDEAAIRQKLSDMSDRLASMHIPASFSLEGEIPALEEDKLDKDSVCPVLVLHSGSDGYFVDTQALYQKIMNAYASGRFTVEADLTPKKPEQVDLEQVWNQVTVEPKNASVERGSGNVIPGSYGLRFDKGEASKLLKNAKDGEQIRVRMTYVEPEILGANAGYQDILGFCQTPHSDNKKRTENLRLACAALNGVVLQPGDVLSYNETLGRRTEENGYMAAPAYSGTELVDSLGGGICQVSSTLYLCSLYAGLETVNRVSHGYPVAYNPIGTDATVSWGAPDLKIRNNLEYPVKIIAEEDNDLVRIWIMGTEVRDYYVRIGFVSSSDGYARNYICKYDRETDQQISRENNHLSSYLSDTPAISGEIGSGQIYKNGLPRDCEIGEPMPETLEAAKRCIPPNQNAE